MTTNLKVPLAVELLHKARGLVGQGWSQGTFYSLDVHGAPRYCVMGALAAAAGGHPYVSLTPEQSAGFQEAGTLLNRVAEKRGAALGAVFFNDMLATRAEDVTGLIDEAIALAIDAPVLAT